MAVKDYITVAGQVIYETDYTNPSGAILTYGRDTLGSVVAGYDAATSALFTVQYKPYGEVITNTGSISSQRFLWAGSWGYRYTPASAASHYVRARHYSSRMGMWNSVDLYWPDEMAYEYVGGRPNTKKDPSGLATDDDCSKPLTPCTDILTSGLLDFPTDLFNCLRKTRDESAQKECIVKYGKGLKGKAADNVLKYIACVVASEDSGMLNQGGRRFNPCSDPFDFGLACCHMRDLYCTMKCIKKHYNNAGLGACLGGCSTETKKCAQNWNEYGD